MIDTLSPAAVAPLGEPARAAGALDPQLRAELLALLLRRYAERLSYGLLHQTRHALGLPARPALAAEPGWRRLYLRDQEALRPLPENTRPLDLFNSLGGRLLVQGVTGAGKTTLLLELALALTQQAQLDPTARIPVVLDLMGWGEANGLRGWLPSALAKQLGASEAFAAELAGGHELALLLDGLDELPGEQQAVCRSAIEDYLYETPAAPLVLACGTEAALYLQRSLNLLGGTVELAPLEPAAAVLALTHGAGPDPLLTRLSEVARAAQATSPLLLHMLLLTSTAGEAESGASTTQNSTLNTQNSLAEPTTQNSKLKTQNYLSLLLRRGQPARCDAAQSLQSLRWLAQQFDEQGTPLFRLDHLQPAMLPSDELRLKVGWLALLIASSSGLLILLMTGNLFGLLHAVFIANTMIGKIKPQKPWEWSISHLVDRFRHRRRQSLLAVLLVVLVAGFGVATGVGLRGVLFAWPFALGFVVLGGIQTSVLPIDNNPMQDMRATLRSGLWTGFIITFVMTQMLWVPFLFLPDPRWTFVQMLPRLGKLLLDWLHFVVLFGLFFGYPLALWRGLGSYIHFTVLRQFLSRLGLLPWNAVAFLGGMVDRLILERDGPAYRFRHPLLRETLADLTDEELEALARRASGSA